MTTDGMGILASDAGSAVPGHLPFCRSKSASEPRPIAPNKPNSPRFWPGIEGGPKKQTQFLPRTRPLIWLSPGAPADRMTAAWVAPGGRRGQWPVSQQESGIE